MDLIPFGILIKPHGLKGYVSARFFNKHSKILKKNKKIFFESNINNFLTIEQINYSSKNNLIKFFEISNRDEIEKLRNIKFCIKRNLLPVLCEDENYFVDFINCELYDQNDYNIGVVVDIIPIDNNDILIVNTTKGEKMIPFAKDLILFFDKSKRKVAMVVHNGVI